MFHVCQCFNWLNNHRAISVIQTCFCHWMLHTIATRPCSRAVVGGCVSQILLAHVLGIWDEQLSKAVNAMPQMLSEVSFVDSGGTFIVYEKISSKWTMVTMFFHIPPFFSCTSWTFQIWVCQSSVGDGTFPPPSEGCSEGRLYRPLPQNRGNCRGKTSWKAVPGKTKRFENLGIYPWENLGMINLMVFLLVGFLSFLHSQSWMNSMCKCMPLETSNQNFGYSAVVVTTIQFFEGTKEFEEIAPI